MVLRCWSPRNWDHRRDTAYTWHWAFHFRGFERKKGNPVADGLLNHYRSGFPVKRGRSGVGSFGRPSLPEPGKPRRSPDINESTTIYAMQCPGQTGLCIVTSRYAALLSHGEVHCTS